MSVNRAPIYDGHNSLFAGLGPDAGGIGTALLREHEGDVDALSLQARACALPDGHTPRAADCDDDERSVHALEVWVRCAR